MGVCRQLDAMGLLNLDLSKENCRTKKQTKKQPALVPALTSSCSHIPVPLQLGWMLVSEQWPRVEQIFLRSWTSWQGWGAAGRSCGVGTGSTGWDGKGSSRKQPAESITRSHFQRKGPWEGWGERWLSWKDGCQAGCRRIHAHSPCLCEPPLLSPLAPSPPERCKVPSPLPTPQSSHPAPSSPKLPPRLQPRFSS